MAKVIDNFLSQEDFKFLQNLITTGKFPFYINNTISFKNETIKNWRWYAIHTVYESDVPNSEYFYKIKDIFIPKFSNIIGFKSLIRIKINLYPHTDTLRENERHFDYPFENHAAVFSLNTCDGFTRLNDGTKVNSVENRIVFFDGNLEHNSTTTTDKFRYNINFNWL